MNFRKMLIAVDESSIAAHAAQIGIDLARSLGADIAFIHVFETPSIDTPEPGMPEDERALAALADLRARFPAGKDAAQFTPQGEPGEEIVTAARDWAADLIVIGSHGRHGLTRALVGSVAESVMRHAPCPVLVVRGLE